MKATITTAITASRSQRGLALLVALLVLVAMSLAGIALVRSVDTASMVAGNIAFRQGATLAADAGVEDARKFLLAATGTALESSDPAKAYYATSQDALDLTGNRTPTVDADNVSWPDTPEGASTPKCLNKDAAGNTVCYIIHRLCDETGPIDTVNCSVRKYMISGDGDGIGGNSLGIRQPGVAYSGRDPRVDDGSGTSTTTWLVYYRVTVRVAGPRNNVSFVQAFLI